MLCSLPAVLPLEHGQDRRFCPCVFLPLKVPMDRTALRRRFPSKTAREPLEMPMSPPPVAAVGIGKPVRPARENVARQQLAPDTRFAEFHAIISFCVRWRPDEPVSAIDAEEDVNRFPRSPTMRLLKQVPNAPRAFAKRKNCLLRADPRAEAPRERRRNGRAGSESACSPKRRRPVRRRAVDDAWKPRSSSGAAPACR